MYVLDTDIVIEFLRGDRKIKEKLAAMPKIYIASPTLSELFFGVYNSKNVKKHYTKLLDFLQGVTILNLDISACECFGKLKSECKNKGKIVGDFDILIAAITIVNGFTLMTRNIKHYQQIRGVPFTTI